MTTNAQNERSQLRKAKLESRADRVALLASDIRERLIFYINSQVISDRLRYQYLEDRYGIPARKWKNVCNRVQMPTLEMLSSVLKDHPYFASWLMTGSVRKQSQVDPSQNGWEEILRNELWNHVDPNSSN